MEGLWYALAGMATVAALGVVLVPVCCVGGLVLAKSWLPVAVRVAVPVGCVGVAAWASGAALSVGAGAPCAAFGALALVAARVSPVGFTGGIACGKSTATRGLAVRHGVAVVDADVVAREVGLR